MLWMQEARQAWKAAADGFSPADDLAMMAEAICYYRHPDLSRDVSRQPTAQNPVQQPGAPLRQTSPQATQQVQLAAESKSTNKLRK